MYMIFLGFFFIMQWSSILVNRSRIDRNNVQKREAYMRKTLRSIGLPSVIGITFGFICLAMNLHWAIPVCTYIALSIIFAFVGPKVCKKNQNSQKSKKK